MLTHINEKGYAKMVDVGDKENTKRTATAKASILVNKEIIDKILNGQVKKGDVLSVAQVAGIMGAKNTPMNIPMCHQINLVGCDLDFNIDEKENIINIYATCKSVGKTGVEMEALSAVTIAALTIYDMCKAIDKKMVIKDVHLLEKSGGKSGNFKF
ncbi:MULTISPECIES: cyclic pyranopterin monophosphate synthase MoaC [Romboutsia]|uniref:Cyclic pyranopterin monophosphate synthase n=1 Tax=Romboutsia hominis TaxID=1507512 RepID=A0A2P2BST5_9FIRM|nr:MULTISPECIES: cyclic pyranopterin monophosphate synthase MoaC [Romboutsia]MCH1960677.1 cyclic pyranopterin monophosphate synthase MoaC [Romboutsia hominis]MCH1968891.1 cyclic pyranopterin monophosphate synthase MoaC [Romboutsia hominis]MDB8804230.1 cyclic pyranopterin monophosphate synthase MoaC [Romboutsia sp. 1001216sp1]MDB8808814.1 cyclic pyranopterin monophosphate synthase MoaC [Romboutsia sp. 1001216sp1]MDB8809876.1 cyclic pyranopterin monophosphate synthase MoaC [Romboutsia sp. 100121